MLYFGMHTAKTPPPPVKACHIVSISFLLLHQQQGEGGKYPGKQ